MAWTQENGLWYNPEGVNAQGEQWSSYNPDAAPTALNTQYLSGYKTVFGETPDASRAKRDAQGNWIYTNQAGQTFNFNPDQPAQFTPQWYEQINAPGHGAGSYAAAQAANPTWTEQDFYNAWRSGGETAEYQDQVATAGDFIESGGLAKSMIGLFAGGALGNATGLLGGESGLQWLGGAEVGAPAYGGGGLSAGAEELAGAYLQNTAGGMNVGGLTGLDAAGGAAGEFGSWLPGMTGGADFAGIPGFTGAGGAAAGAGGITLGQAASGASLASTAAGLGGGGQGYEDAAGNVYDTGGTTNQPPGGGAIDWNNKDVVDSILKSAGIVLPAAAGAAGSSTWWQSVQDFLKSPQGISTLGNVLGSGIGALGSYFSSQAQQQAGKEALDLQRYMYDQNRTDLAPWRQAGSTALNQLGGLYGLPGYNKVDFTADPGYQWRMSQGEQSINRAMTPRQSFDSGATLKALQRYGQDYASNEFGNVASRLSNMAGLSSAPTMAGVQAGANYGNAAGNIMQGIGNARASGYMGMANSIGQGVGNIANNYGQYRLFG